MIASVERAPAKQVVVGGILREVSEPVLIILEQEVGVGSVSCHWLFTHKGLVAGPYELVNGLTVLVPEKFTSRDRPGVFRGVTLEVSNGEEE